MLFNTVILMLIVRCGEAHQASKFSIISFCSHNPSCKYLFLPFVHAVIYIKMVDVSCEFVKPHIIDVKIGAEAWQPDASAEKIQRQRDRCPYLAEICFQVLGAKVGSLRNLLHNVKSLDKKIIIL